MSRKITQNAQNDESELKTVRILGRVCVGGAGVLQGQRTHPRASAYEKPEAPRQERWGRGPHAPLHRDKNAMTTPAERPP